MCWSRDLLLAAMQGCDAVFHTAGVVADYWQQNVELTYQVNVDGTRNVVDAAMAAGVPRLVHTSSQAALGFDDGQTPIDETRPLQPAAPCLPLRPQQAPGGTGSARGDPSRAARRDRKPFGSGWAPEMSPSTTVA